MLPNISSTGTTTSIANLRRRPAAFRLRVRSCERSWARFCTGHAGSVGSVALYLRCEAAISWHPPEARPSLSPPAAWPTCCAGSPLPHVRKGPEPLLGGRGALHHKRTPVGPADRHTAPPALR